MGDPLSLYSVRDINRFLLLVIDGREIVSVVSLAMERAALYSSVVEDAGRDGCSRAFTAEKKESQLLLHQIKRKETEKSTVVTYPSWTPRDESVSSSSSSSYVSPDSQY